MFELIGVNKDYKKIQDDITAIQFHVDMCLDWDLTSADSFAPSNVIVSATSPWSAVIAIPNN